MNATRKLLAAALAALILPAAAFAGELQDEDLRLAPHGGMAEFSVVRTRGRLPHSPIAHGTVPLSAVATNLTNMPSRVFVSLADFSLPRRGRLAGRALWRYRFPATIPGAAATTLPMPCPHAPFGTFYGSGVMAGAESRSSQNLALPDLNGRLFSLCSLDKHFASCPTDEDALRAYRMKVAVFDNSAKDFFDSAAFDYDTAMRRRFNPAWHPPKVPKARRTCSYELETCVLSPSDVSSWRDLTIYDIVAIDSAAWDALPAECRDRIETWVMTGGALSISGCAEASRSPLGFGAVLRHASAFDLAAFADAAVASLENQTLGCAYSAVPGDAQACHAVSSAVAETPVGRVMLILFAFAFLSGPCMLLLLARLNKRIHVLWLFPVVSAAFAAAVATVILFVDGTRPRLKQFVASYVDEASGRVVTVQNDVVMAPFGISATVDYPSNCSAAYSCNGDAPAGCRCKVTVSLFSFSRESVPPRWPVRFRTVTVRSAAGVPETVAAWRARSDGAASVECADSLGAATMPLACELKERKIVHVITGRGSSK